MRLPPHLTQGAGELHRAIVEQAQDAIILADREGVIVLWNRGAEIIFGWGAQEAIGQNLSLIIPAKFRRAHDEGFHRAVQAGQMRHDGRVMTTRAQHKWGCRLYVELSFGLLKDDNGIVTGVFAIGRDGTARHLKEVARRVEAEAHADH
jgi:PAS domain S-box-containing protein